MIILDIEKGDTRESVIQIKNLIIIGELDKALKLIKICKENLVCSDPEKVLYQILECDVMYQQGLYEKLYTFAEQIYKERLKSGDNLIAIDMLNLMADCMLIFFHKMEKAFEIIKQSESILKIFTQNSSKGILQREAYLAYVKGIFHFIKINNKKALRYFKQSAALGEDFDNKLITILSLLDIANINIFRKGDLEQAFIYADKGQILANKSNHKFAIAYSYYTMGNLYYIKGKIDKSIFFFKQSIVLFKKLNNTHFMAVVYGNLGESYRTKGNLKRALECLVKCLVLNRDLGLNWGYAINHDYLIQILVDIGDFQRARQYLYQFKTLKYQLKDERLNFFYNFDKALILKGSFKCAKKMQAKEIFKQLIRKNKIPFEVLIKSLLSLCELLLDELLDTNNMELLNEVPLYIDQIVDFAKKHKSYLLLADTYLLKANFESFTLNFDRAKSNLVKAQNFAERYGMTSLVQRVLIQRKTILHQTRKWQKLNDVNKVLTDFTNFVPLKKQIRYMIKKRSILKDLDI